MTSQINAGATVDAPGHGEAPGRQFLSRSPAAWAIVIAWGLAVAGFTAAGGLATGPGALPRAALILAVGPGAVFLSVYALFSPLRAWVVSLDLAEIIGFQAWRVVGAAFLFAAGLGQLPLVFALPAGIGDVAVGLAAPAIALAAARRSHGWRLGAYGLAAAGIFDFLLAFTTGVLSREGALLHFSGEPSSHLLGTLPFSLIPTFLVPVFLILHIIALLKLNSE